MAIELPLCSHVTRDKISYASELHAQAAGAYWHQKPYHCHHCGYWHLTTLGRRYKGKRNRSGASVRKRLLKDAHGAT